MLYILKIYKVNAKMLQHLDCLEYRLMDILQPEHHKRRREINFSKCMNFGLVCGHQFSETPRTYTEIYEKLKKYLMNLASASNVDSKNNENIDQIQ